MKEEEEEENDIKVGDGDQQIAHKMPNRRICCAACFNLKKRAMGGGGNTVSSAVAVEMSLRVCCVIFTHSNASTKVSKSGSNSS
jgi:hypothetical protein